METAGDPVRGAIVLALSVVSCRGTRQTLTPKIVEVCGGDARVLAAARFVVSDQSDRSFNRNSEHSSLS